MSSSSSARLRQLRGGFCEGSVWLHSMRLALGSLSPALAAAAAYKLLAFSCKRRGFCPSCGARRMSRTAAHLADHVVPLVPVRPWVLSQPIPLRVLLVAQPELVTPVLQVVQRVVTRHLRGAAGLKAEVGQGGAVTLFQRFGSAANLDTHLHCLVRARLRHDGRCVPTSTASACTRRCGCKPKTARGLSSCAATSPAPRDRTNGCSSTLLGT